MYISINIGIFAEFFKLNVIMKEIDEETINELYKEFDEQIEPILDNISIISYHLDCAWRLIEDILPDMSDERKEKIKKSESIIEEECSKIMGEVQEIIEDRLEAMENE